MPAKSAPYHHGNLRECLLAAGELLLEADGPVGVTLRGIARRAGVSHAAPYRHFQDKKALLSALAARGYARLEREMLVVGTRFPDDPLRQLLASGEGYIRLGLERPAMFQLMFGGLLPKSSASPDLALAGNKAFGALVAILGQGQAVGVFRAGPTLDLALAVWSLVHGVTELAIAGRFPPPMAGTDAVVLLGRNLCALLVDGLAGPELTCPASP